MPKNNNKQFKQTFLGREGGKEFLRNFELEGNGIRRRNNATRARLGRPRG